MKQTILSKTATPLQPVLSQHYNNNNPNASLKRDTTHTNSGGYLLDTFTQGVNAFDAIYPRLKPQTAGAPNTQNNILNHQRLHMFQLDNQGGGTLVSSTQGGNTLNISTAYNFFKNGQPIAVNVGMNNNIQPILHKQQLQLVSSFNNNNNLSNQFARPQTGNPSLRQGSRVNILNKHKNNQSQQSSTSQHAMSAADLHSSASGRAAQHKRFKSSTGLQNDQQEFGFQTHQLRNASSKIGLVIREEANESGLKLRKSRLSSQNAGNSMADMSFEKRAYKNSPSLKETGTTEVKQPLRQRSALGTKIYDADGSVKHLSAMKSTNPQSTQNLKTRTVNFAPTSSQGGKKSHSLIQSPTLSMSGGKNDQLSTEETEIRHAVQQIEAQIEMRAQERYERMQTEKGLGLDVFKMTKQINDITFKYRVQNGGGLSNKPLSQRYPNEVRVRSVKGLDVTPAGHPADKGISFSGFECRFQQPQPEKIRQDYPKVGSGETYTKVQKEPSILHNTFKWEQFVKPPSRYQTRRIATQQVSPAKTSQKILLNPSQPVSPSKRAATASQKETLLLKRMSEARKKFLKKETESSSSENEDDYKQKRSCLTSVPSPTIGKKDKHIEFNQEDRCEIQRVLKQEDKFIRDPVESRRLRIVSQENGNRLPIDMQKFGFDKTTQQFAQNFDPMRLKILVMPCSEANPVGKNADYFFLKGFKFGACDEHANAMASYLKGLDIKNDHLLCRFNLGVTLFKLGLFEESVHQYEILAKQHSGKPVVLYNKALCELQAGKFEEASLSAEKCIEEIMKKSKNLKSNTSQERNHISSKSTTQNQQVQQNLNLGQSFHQPSQRSHQASHSNLHGSSAPNPAQDQYQKPKYPSFLTPSDLEMLADLHQLIGLAALRTQNIKRAGKCFEEARVYRVDRRSELVLMMERAVAKMIQARIMEHFRRRIKSQVGGGGTYYQQTFGEEGFYQGNYVGKGGRGQSEIRQPQVGELVMIRDQMASRVSRRGMARAASLAKIYLTDVDIINYEQPAMKEKRKTLKRSNSQPLKQTYLLLKEMIDFETQLFHNQKLPKHQVPNNLNLLQVPINNGQQKSKVTPKNLQQSSARKSTSKQPQITQSLDDLTYPQLMDLFRSIISQKADPERCYLYIDDERTIRLDKVLGLPNSFEVKRGANLNEKEKAERGRREAIEMYYNVQGKMGGEATNNTEEKKKKDKKKSPIKKQSKKELPNPENLEIGADGEDTSNESEDSDTKHQNYLIENYFHLKDRLQIGLPDQKRADEEAFQDFMNQIKKFNQKLDLSLNYFLNEQQNKDRANNTSASANNTKKLDAEIEQNIKEIKDKIVEQANKKVEITLPRMRLEEIEELNAEMLNQGQRERDVHKIEQMLMKLKYFKNLNPQLRRLVIQRAEYKLVPRDTVLYKQSEEGHHFYILIRGSVTLLSNRADFGNFDLYLRSYYDGDVFGEQPQLFTKETGDPQQQQLASDEQLLKLSLRDSTCIANEECLLLEVSNQVKHEFYRTDSSNQYEMCLHWLRKNPIFRLTEGFYLLQMIFNIESRKYQLGESLVQAGEVPEGMFIITKGQCRAVLQGIGIKNQDSGEFTRFQKQPKTFICGIRPAKQKQNASSPKNEKKGSHKEESLKRFQAESSVFNSIQGDEKKCFQSTRIYLDDEGKHLPNHIAFTNNVNYGNLVPGDSFGSRVLLPDDEIAKRLHPDPEDVTKSIQMDSLANVSSGAKHQQRLSASITNGKQLQQSMIMSTKPYFNQPTLNLFRETVKNLKASALSIIAESKEVEVLILKTNILSYLPETEKDKIYTDIAKVNDPDKPASMSEIMRIKNSEKKWEGFRSRLVKDIRKSQFMDRHKGALKR